MLIVGDGLAICFSLMNVNRQLASGMFKVCVCQVANLC